MTRLHWALLSLGALVLVNPPVQAVDQAEIDKAVELGVTYLKRTQGARQGDPGPVALAALTLLECGVDPTDPSVAPSIQSVREASVTMTQTYNLALAILLLDRVGDPGDVALIESMAIRLMAGQNAQGYWSYNCPSIDQGEVRRLSTHLQQQNDVRTKKPLPKETPLPKKRAFKDLPREIQQQAVMVNRLRGRGGNGGGDNSNTQFATLGLWVARRHGLPVDDSLRMVEAHFRMTQHPDGGWDYWGGTMKRGGHSTATMTCAGLLALAVSHGVANDQGVKKVMRDPTKDNALKAGLLLLGTVIGHPLEAFGKPARGRNRGLIPQADGKAFYFLWSMERVAVALNLKTIAKKDWYAWGAEVLLANQNPDGSWQGAYGGSGADTCFALLFLRRANFARDLTASLGNKLQDPGDITLKTGGVGGGAITGNKEKATLKDPLAADPTAKEDMNDKRRTTASPVTIPSAMPDTRAHRTGREVVATQNRAERERLLKELRDSKGADYTDALALIIPQLDGEAKASARQALADRFTRLTPGTLRTYMKDPDPEVRRAAALASGMKDSRENIPSMIELLVDSETSVVRASHAALKAMTGKDFGPEKDAMLDDQKKAVAAWQQWWTQQGKK